MKQFSKALGFGFLTESACAFIGLLGVLCSDTLGHITEFIHAPAQFIVDILISQSGRETILRDIALLFITQWAIYTAVIFTALALKQSRKH